MRNLDEINMNEGGRPVERPAPSQNEIMKFEAKFRVTLPPDYIALLQHSNGGHPELNSFVPDGSSSDNRWAVDHFYHLSSDTDSVNLAVAASEWQSILGERCIPIARDGGGNQIYLDGEGKISLCIHDESFKRVLVAESFAAFIDKLEEDPDMV